MAALGDGLPRLKVSENHRFLVTESGRPFYWQGDTAWELFHRLNREEADIYLRNRADRRYTVIQAVALAELDGLNDPNAYGEKPLINNDPTQPNEAYFQHVDWIVKRANELGIYVGFCPRGEINGTRRGALARDFHFTERRRPMANGSANAIAMPGLSGSWEGIGHWTKPGPRCRRRYCVPWLEDFVAATEGPI